MTGTFIKIIALIAMIFDHIGYYIPNTPEELRWVGRLAAPIFLYFIAEGFKKTTNQKKYILRLYLFGVLMAILTLIINSLFGGTGQEITANFFATLFMVVCILYLIDQKKARYWVYFAFWQLLSSIFCIVFSEIIILHNNALYYFYSAILGNSLFVEGGIFMVGLGVLFYFSKTKGQLIFNYTTFVILIYLLILNFGSNPGPFSYYFLPFADYQWIMIGALPFIISYNGKRGIEIKYLFYVFYPLHIIVLYFIGLKFI